MSYLTYEISFYGTHMRRMPFPVIILARPKNKHGVMLPDLLGALLLGLQDGTFIALIKAIFEQLLCYFLKLSKW